MSSKITKMKNPDSHIYLYAQGWYEENDMWKDLGIIVSDRCNYTKPASMYAVYSLLVGMVMDRMLESPNPRNRILSFMADITPRGHAQRGGDIYKFYEAVVTRCLSELGQAPVKDWDGNVIMELDEPDPDILPLSKSAEKLMARKKINNSVTEEMRKAGDDIAEDIIVANAVKTMNGLGGTKTWDEWLDEYDGGNLDLIRQFLDDEIDSATAIYIAMDRAKKGQ